MWACRVLLPYHLYFIFAFWLESWPCHPNSLWSSCVISPEAKWWAAKGRPRPTAHRALSEFALCWKKKCAFWKSWRLHSLFSKHYISRQWVSSKLWEHLSQSGFVTFSSWGVGRLQWSVGSRSLLTQESRCCFQPWKDNVGNIEDFSQGGFWAAFPSLCKAVLWAWLMSTSCSSLVPTPQCFLALKPAKVYVL